MKRLLFLSTLLLASPLEAQTTPTQRADKIITDANVAENAMQRVMTEANRLKADLTLAPIPQQRAVKIITDANIAENAMQRVMAEAKRLKADLAAPTAAPTPTPTPVPVPTATFPTVDDVKLVPSGLNVPALLGSATIPNTAAPDVVGAFRFVCSAGQLSYDDPIVYPGQHGKAHLHQFFGNLEANGNSTYESLRKSGDSTCMNPLNRSAYWMPAMLDGKGNAVRPDVVTIYYKRLPASDPRCRTWAKACVGIPRGLRVVFGWDQTRPNDPQPNTNFNFGCQNVWVPIGPGDKSLRAVSEYCNTPGYSINARIHTPPCWNGRDLDSPDHRSHMAEWVTGGCPSTHPYIVPEFTLGAIYSIEAGDDTRLWHLSSDHMLPKFEAGASFHSDYFEAWEEAIRLRWEAACIDKLLNCSDGDLGDGQIMARGQYYPGKANPRLVPIPAMPHG